MFAIALLLNIISNPATRPFLSLVFINVCQITAAKLSESCARIWFCCSNGKESIILFTEFAHPEVWSVARTSCPVSAAVNASWIVSRSRISPTIIASGFSRREDFRAF